MTTQKIYQEALTAAAQELFPRFSQLPSFYLVGGTALALQIGHRRSVDFDFFTARELPDNLRLVKRIFRPWPCSLTYRSPEQLNLLIGGIKTTFLSYPYPLVERTKKYQGVRLVSVAEIAAMKAFSIGKRLSYKDYVDWYFLLKEGHVDLKQVIRLAEKKFGQDFNDRLFLGQLVFFKDIPTQKIDFLRGAVERPAIERFLQAKVRAFKL